MARFILPLRCLAEAIPALFESGVLEIQGIARAGDDAVAFDASVLGFGVDEEIVMVVRNYEGEPRHYDFEPKPTIPPTDPDEVLWRRWRAFFAAPGEATGECAP